MSLHMCPGGCGGMVANHLFACRADWVRLPWSLRLPILTAHRAAPLSPEHREAMAEAVAWFRENPSTLPPHTDRIHIELNHTEGDPERDAEGGVS